MGKVKQYRNVISTFISSENGQRFFNFAYSIGAAIVIWGALFKILHLPGGNTLLSIGMGTEVLMFILTAFDRPPREYRWEDVFPVLDSRDEADRPATAAIAAGVPAAAAVHTPTATAGPTTPATPANAAEACSEQMAGIADEMARLRATTRALNEVSETLLQSYRAITENSGSISGAAGGYAEQMQALDRNIAGLNTIYEIQLRSVSSQLDAIERVNRGIKDISDMYTKASEAAGGYCRETERMALYMQQLNGVYERMLNAMTVNMYRPPVPASEPDKSTTAQ